MQNKLRYLKELNLHSYDNANILMKMCYYNGIQHKMNKNNHSEFTIRFMYCLEKYKAKQKKKQ